jgi:2-polyprenyl-3-methyl-5-hydroxy-6-metoxy-1,4-benzoquinol methylase
MTTEEQEETRVAWDNIAAGYDELITPTNFDLGAEALRRAGLRPGMRLLDVAAGSGAVSLSAARLGANVTAVDISPVMIERLKARAGEEVSTWRRVSWMDTRSTWKMTPSTW